MGLMATLREFFTRLLTGGRGPRHGGARRGRAGVSDPDALRPLGTPSSLGPKATLTEASALGHMYLLKRWNDLPASARRELVRLIEQRREISGPGFVPVISVGERSIDRKGYVYCIQEHRPRTLRKWLSAADAAVPLEVAASIVRQIASALKTAHERSVIHGSLSPDAIYLSSAEGPDAGEVAVDFVRYTGMDLAQNPAFTIAEVFPTGRSYLAPEGLLGNPPDEQTDLFVLGVVAYEVFTCRLPFGEDGTSTTMKVRGMLNAQAEPISRHRPDLPKHWDGAIMKLLAKDRRLRFRTADEFLRAVESEL